MTPLPAFREVEVIEVEPQSHQRNNYVALIRTTCGESPPWDDVPLCWCKNGNVAHELLLMSGYFRTSLPGVFHHLGFGVQANRLKEIDDETT